MKKIDYKLRLNIRSIILYERLTGESFSQFNTSIEKIFPLLYCLLVANNEFTSTYEDTINFLFTDKEIIESLTKELETLLAFETQFSCRPYFKQDVDEMKDTGSNDPVFVSQLIPILVSDCGLDINFIMDKMSYTEIDDYIYYRDEKYKSRMEEQRLFTYLGMLPHIDSRKCKLESILPFDWEKKKKRKQGLDEIKKNKNKLDEFLKSGNIQINNGSD